MDWNEREDERKALKGIAATLLALAVLAEFLCLLPVSLRVLVLSLLRPAEAVARAFAVERTGRALALPATSVGPADGDGCAEALRLARCFRALASIFAGLQDFAAGRPFLGGLDGRLARRATAVAWRGRFTKLRRAAFARGAACIDTS
jgi:hypothetical protein